MAGTFGSATHAADQNIRTDFTIVLANYNNGLVTVYMKNVGTAQIPLANVENSADVFISDAEGTTGSNRLSYGSTDTTSATLTQGSWVVYPCPLNQACIPLNQVTGNPPWIPGETLEVIAFINPALITPGDNLNFQFILPSGVSRSTVITT
jgi:hypothetical protein